MNCIIIDDEPLAREAMELLVGQSDKLNLLSVFNSAVTASDYLKKNTVDLVFLDIQMPHVTGIEFAREIPKETLVIFTTAYTEYAVESYEMDAIDYLVKPIEFSRFQKAVEKANIYHSLLSSIDKEAIEAIQDEFMFVKSDRRYYKVEYKDILFIEGLKDYSIIQTEKQRLITRMNLKTMHEQLPATCFMRVNKSYIVNTSHIESFDNNDIFIRQYELSIGSSYRDQFFSEFVFKKR